MMKRNKSVKGKGFFKKAPGGGSSNRSGGDPSSARTQELFSTGGTRRQ